MPTREDLEHTMLAEFELFGGDPKINGYPKSDENSKWTGEKNGEMHYNPKTGAHLFIPKNSED